MRIACIGSREISTKVESCLIAIGAYIAKNGHYVVSGGALGSDASFAAGANLISPTKVKLFLPWATYNKELIVKGNLIETEITTEAQELAMAYHPKYDSLRQGAQRMMGRNASIILDSDITLAFLNHSKIGGGGTGHGFRVSMALKHPTMDISGLEKGSLSVQEIIDWIDKIYEQQTH